MQRILALATLIVLFGCEGPEGPQGPAGPAGPERVYVLGKVLNTGWVYVEVFSTPVIPWVTINGDTISGVYWYDYLYAYGHGSFIYDDSISVNPGDLLYLEVNYTRGIANSSSRLPGSFEITSHDTSQIFYIPVHSDLAVSWSTSSHADFYRAGLYLDYYYIDTLGQSRSYYVSADTSIISTSVNFSAKQLFAADLDSILYVWYGSFSIRAMSGPMLKPGSEGNMEGDGVGFFWGETRGGYLEIGIEGVNEKAEKKLTEKELTRKWFKKARQTDPNFRSVTQTP